jgi:hypothetical protein
MEQKSKKRKRHSEEFKRETLDGFNDHIEGPIEVIAKYPSEVADAQ